MSYSPVLYTYIFIFLFTANQYNNNAEMILGEHFFQMSIRNRSHWMYIKHI